MWKKPRPQDWTNGFCGKCNWIMVIDNLDDLDMMIMRYIPSQRGMNLFTTRDVLGLELER
jgi:hypothetical protein